jgi:hypothetical protein
MTDEPLLRFRSGLYNLTVERPHVELIPCWIENMSRVLPKGEFLPVPLLCRVVFGAPLAGPRAKIAMPSETRRATLLALNPVRSGPTDDPRVFPLLAGLIGVLVTASAVSAILRWRAGKPSPTLTNLNDRINAWWVMVAVLGTASCSA